MRQRRRNNESGLQSYDVRAKNAVLYARVSSKEQEKEGFSIPAQQRLLKDYAVTKGFQLVNEFVDIETAKKSGRPGFNEMVKFLTHLQHLPPKIVLKNRCNP